MNISKYFNPRWTIWAGNWTRGSVESFWLKRNAEKYIQKIKPLENCHFIDIVDEYTGETTRLKDNPDKVPFKVGYK